MFKHLLVPLDGSKLAEAVLPTVDLLARSFSASVTLLHVIERNAPKKVHGDTHLQDKEEAEKYLRKIIEKKLPSVEYSNFHVHPNPVRNVSASIAEHIEEVHPDLLVMCTHGKGSIKNMVIGNIAQRAIKQAAIPILLLNEKKEDHPKAVQFEKFAIALDMEHSHSFSEELLQNIALHFHSHVLLLSVVRTVGSLSGKSAATGRYSPAATAELLDIATEETEKELSGKAREWTRLGIETAAHLRRGKPANEIVEGARDFGAGLIVSCTHGKSGMEAFWAGSITPQIAGLSELPQLLIPVTEETADK